MKNLPLPMRWILNIIFFFVYYFMFLFITGFVIVFTLEILGAETELIIDTITSIIAIIGIPIIGATIFFRDSFYLLEQKKGKKIIK